MDSKDTGDLDKWIEILLACKPLSENDISKLCDQVNQLL